MNKITPNLNLNSNFCFDSDSNQFGNDFVFKKLKINSFLSHNNNWQSIECLINRTVIIVFLTNNLRYVLNNINQNLNIVAKYSSNECIPSHKKS